MCRQSRQCFKQNLDDKNIVPHVVAPVIFIFQVGEKKVKKKTLRLVCVDDLQVLYNTALLNVMQLTLLSYSVNFTSFVKVALFRCPDALDVPSQIAVKKLWEYIVD